MSEHKAVSIPLFRRMWKFFEEIETFHNQAIHKNLLSASISGLQYNIMSCLLYTSPSPRDA